MKTVIAASSQFETTAKPRIKRSNLEIGIGLVTSSDGSQLPHRTMGYEVTPIELGRRTALHKIRA